MSTVKLTIDRFKINPRSKKIRSRKTIIVEDLDDEKMTFILCGRTCKEIEA